MRRFSWPGRCLNMTRVWFKKRSSALAPLGRMPWVAREGRGFERRRIKFKCGRSERRAEGSRIRLALQVHPTSTTTPGSSNALIVLHHRFTAHPIHLSSGTVGSCNGYPIFVYMCVGEGRSARRRSFLAQHGLGRRTAPLTRDRGKK
jgi:hypothetical protein